MAREVKDRKEGGLSVPKTTLNTINEVSVLLDQAGEVLKKLDSLIEKAKAYHGRELAVYCRDNLLDTRKSLREPIDALELSVGKNDWPVPSYGDLLFHII